MQNIPPGAIRLNNYRIQIGSDKWSYVVIDDKLLPTIPLHGYELALYGKILVDSKPTFATSKKITIYANTVERTGGYFIGDGNVPNGSVVTATFYTSYEGKGSILSHINNGVLLCTQYGGPLADRCVKHGTDLLKFLRLG